MGVMSLLLLNVHHYGNCIWISIATRLSKYFLWQRSYPSILAFIEKNFMETIGIFVAVFLATTVGFYFERDAAKKFNLLTALSEEQPVKVRRNGKVMEINATCGGGRCGTGGSGR